MEKLKPEGFLKNDRIISPISPTFCILPWLHLATRTWGGVTPCCVGEPLGENLNDTTFSKVWNSSAMKNLRKMMLKGEESSICKRCYNEEKVGIISHRMQSHKLWKNYYISGQLLEKTDKTGDFSGKTIYLDLRLGNKCNLECTMCAPPESSRWENLLEEILKNAKTSNLKKYFFKHESFMKITPSKLWYEREEFKQDLYSQIPF